MKTIINKKTEITERDENGEIRELSFADLALITLNIPPDKGWTLDEMRIRFKCEEKLKDKEVNAKIKLEDAEFAKVFECSKLNWAVKHKDILAYCDHLEEVNNK